MDKTTNTGANKEKDSFKNTPHVADRTGSSANLGTNDIGDIGSDTGKGMNATSGATSGRSMSGSSLSDARSAIMEQARPAVDYVRTNFRPVLDNSQKYFGDAQTLVRNNPFYAMAGAAAIGVFVGMMFSRSSNRSI